MRTEREFSRRRTPRHFLPAFLIAVAIFVSSSLPGFGRLENTPLYDQDKLIHVFAYALLGAAVAWGFSEGLLRPLPWRLVCLAALLTAAYGVTDEIHQYFVPNRFASWKDLSADAFGGLCGSWLLCWYARTRQPVRACPTEE